MDCGRKVSDKLKMLLQQSGTTGKEEQSSKRQFGDFFKSNLLQDSVGSRTTLAIGFACPNRLDLKYPQTAVCGIRTVVRSEFVCWT